MISVYISGLGYQIKCHFEVDTDVDTVRLQGDPLDIVELGWFHDGKTIQWFLMGIRQE